MIYESIVRLFALLVGCLYPAFMSNKVLNANKSGEGNMRIWVSYWIVYGVYLIFDYFTQGFVALVPFLDEFKLLFLCWLLPTLGGGSKIIYDKFLCSFLKSNEKSIDQALSNASQKGGDIIGQVWSVIVGQGMRVINCLCISRHNNHKLRITPSIEVIINEVLAKRELGGRVRQEQITASVDHGPQEDMAGEMKTSVLAKEQVDRAKPKVPPKPAVRKPQLPVNASIDISLD